MGLIGRIIIGVMIWVELTQTASARDDLSRRFDAAAEQVKSRLLDAPEASRVYLEFWTTLARREGIEGPMLPPKAQAGPYQPPETESGWRPNGYPLVSPEWAKAQPVSLSRADQFRPPAPPALDSEELAAALSNIFNIGDQYSTDRDADEALASAYWADGTGTETPPGRWNRIALLTSQDRPKRERITLMLALNLALYDAGIAAWDAKYHYLYPRPGQRIRAQYPNHADWTPMMEPPFHPEYVSGHSTFSGAAAEILTAKLGPQPFCLTEARLFDLERCFDDFNAAAEEAGQSRLWGGIHYDFSNREGLALGRKVAREVLRNFN